MLMKLTTRRSHWINLWIKIFRGMTSSSAESLSVLFGPFGRFNAAENSFRRNEIFQMKCSFKTKTKTLMQHDT